MVVLNWVTLSSPVFETANHFFDLVAEQCKVERTFLRTIASGSPAVNDDRCIERNLLWRSFADRGMGNMHCAFCSALIPGVLSSYVNQHHRFACIQVGMNVGRVRFKC